MTVGLVVVSHSAKLAEGVAELARQMAPDVAVLPAGGLPDGGIGTDYDSVLAAAGSAESGDGVALLYDLGSAQMTAELVVESLGSPDVAEVVDAPLVEGAVAAAVTAQGGADLRRVAESAAAAGAPADRASTPAVLGSDASRNIEVILRNEVGLHARPAALLARSVAGLDVEVRVRLGEQEADAASVLALMSLGARQGDQIEIRVRGEQADEAVERINELVKRDFE
jgi:PTS hybrid protein